MPETSKEPVVLADPSRIASASLWELVDGAPGARLAASPDLRDRIALARFEQMAGYERRAHERLSEVIAIADDPATAREARAQQLGGAAFEPRLEEVGWRAMEWPAGDDLSALRVKLAISYALLMEDGVEPPEGWSAAPTEEDWLRQLARVHEVRRGFLDAIADADPATVLEAFDLMVLVPLLVLTHSLQAESAVDAELVRDVAARAGIRALDPFVDYLLGVSHTAAARVAEAAEPLQRAADGFSAAPNLGWWMTVRGTQYVLSVMTDVAPPGDVDRLERELLAGTWRDGRRSLGHGVIASVALMLAGHGDLEAARRVALSEGDIDELQVGSSNRCWLLDVIFTAALADGELDVCRRMLRIVDHMMPSPWQQAAQQRMRTRFGEGPSEDAAGPTPAIPGSIDSEVLRTRWVSLAQAVEGGHRTSAYRELAALDEFAARARASALRVRAVQLFRPQRTATEVPLSTRQLEVATLAAAGMTNREIARELFLGIRTVEGYVAGALKALGLSRREELASVALLVDVPAPPSGDAVRLTLRQGQVAALVAAGASNAEIATALGVSEKTVDKHMTVLKERTGVTTRTALVPLFRTAIAPAATSAASPSTTRA
jgi:DNA-binding NarL/FixJ family response regulator